jgi:hypothetical protein
MLASEHVSEETKRQLRAKRAGIDPLSLSDLIESKQQAIQQIVEEIEDRRAEERWRAGEAAATKSHKTTQVRVS